MRRLIVKTVCTATVEEEWVFHVPDDYDSTDATVSSVMASPGVELSVENDVAIYGERDREVIAIEDGGPA